MDGEWLGPGWYRPADGTRWEEANGDTKWIACEVGNSFGTLFSTYRGFKKYKRILRLKDKLIK